MVSKSQLAQRIAARGAAPAQAQHAVDAVLGEITAALAAGERVTFVGFGTFEPVARPARTARNPRTGAAVPVPAATVARFHAGAGLKGALDGSKPVLGQVGSLPVPAAPAVVAAVAAAAASVKAGAKSAKAVVKTAKAAAKTAERAAKAVQRPPKGTAGKGRPAKGKADDKKADKKADKKSGKKHKG